MSIDSYDTLKAAILKQLNRDTDSDAQTMCPQWIELCEARSRRLLRSTQGEVRSQNLGVTSQYTNLPSDFVSFQSFRLLGGTERVLEYMPSQEIDRICGITTSPDPRYFDVVGSALKLGPAPSTTISVEAIYYALAALTSVQTTNWLLASHPDAYLYGALIEAGEYYEDPRWERWFAKFNSILDEINASSSAFRGRLPLVAQPFTQVV